MLGVLVFIVFAAAGWKTRYLQHQSMGLGAFTPSLETRPRSFAWVGSGMIVDSCLFYPEQLDKESLSWALSPRQHDA